MKALVLALIALVFASVVPAAGAQVSPEADLPSRHVGDTWQYSYHDTRKSKPGSPFSVTVTDVAPDGGFTVSIGGQKVSFAKGSGGITTAAKGLVFPFPMKVGKGTYKDSADAQGMHWEFDVTREVTTEKVKGPAGTFDAFKVVFVNKYIGTAGFGVLASGTITDTWWYAPVVKNFVKRTFSDDGDRAGPGLVVRELVLYKLQ